MWFGGRQARLETVVYEQTPHMLVGDRADKILNVDAAVSQRSAGLVGLGYLGCEGDDALEA